MKVKNNIPKNPILSNESHYKEWVVPFSLLSIQCPFSDKKNSVMFLYHMEYVISRFENAIDMILAKNKKTLLCSDCHCTL